MVLRLANEDAIMAGYTTLDFRVLPQSDPTAFTPLDEETVAFLRRRMGPTQQPIAVGGMDLAFYPDSEEWELS
jgi:hypothetical protein